MGASIDPRGPAGWGGSRDSEGHRTYWIEFFVNCLTTDGPANVLSAVGLPQIGSMWNFGLDFDIWAWCLPDATMTPTTQAETCTKWKVKCNFSTKPPPVNRCADQQITNPIMIPPEISGEDVKYTEEATYDRFGKYIMNSAWERIRGHQIEFDKNRNTIKIKMNFPFFLGPLVEPMVDTVNAFPIFGQNVRCVKLDKAPFQRKFYGSCYVYYEYTFEFSINVNAAGLSLHDKDIIDEGHKALNGHWGTGAGSGCIITATVDGSGAITSASVSLGGNSYQSNTTVNLNVLGGTSGVVKAFVNSSGVVTGVLVLRSGSGYSAGALSTSPGLGWILDNIGSGLPDPTNPSHFNQFQDQHGNPTSVVLNGAGIPADQVVSLPAVSAVYWVSLQSFNHGHPLVSGAFWAIQGRLGQEWNNAVTYSLGDQVLYTNVAVPLTTEYLCIVSNINVVPGTDPTKWAPIPNSITNYPSWNALVDYGIGDTVYQQGNQNSFSTIAGNIHIEKYDESDFSLLGVPLSF
jgi:hypothetical protein